MGNSLLVTFELTARGGGTLLRMTETGFREMGWEVAVLEEQYQDHVARLGLLPAPAGRLRRQGRGGSMTSVDDELWSAVGDPTRRRMLDLLLIDGQGTATSLSEQLPVTRQAVAKHLAVLDRVGLVHGAAAGGSAATGSTTPSSPGPPRSWRRSGRTGTAGSVASPASPSASNARSRAPKQRPRNEQAPNKRTRRTT